MAAWSDADKSPLRRLMKSPKSLESQIHELPGHTVDCARAYARLMRLPPKPRARSAIRARIVTLMKDKIPRTTLEITRELKVEKKKVRDLLAILIDAGEVHLTGEHGRYHAAYYKVGPTPPGMPTRTRPGSGDRGAARRIAEAESETEEEAERRLDEAYRSQARWWPRADPVVVVAMSSMVRAGRGAE